MSQQTLDPIHSPSKFIRISHASTLSTEVHHGHVGEEKERGYAKLIDNFSHESDVTFLRTPF